MKIPFLGICLGMQAAVIEYSRNMLGIAGANSKEFSPDISDEQSAIIFMPEGSKDKLGGTMRLGVRTTILRENSQALELYLNNRQVEERHRHRYEVNPNLVDQLEKGGLLFTGKDTSGNRMEVVELDKKTHPYFLAAQFHPEFNSRPLRPAPLFLGFLNAVKNLKK